MEGATDDFTVVLSHEGLYKMGSAGPFAVLTQRHSRTKDDLIAKLGDTNNKMKKLLWSVGSNYLPTFKNWVCLIVEFFIFFIYLYFVQSFIYSGYKSFDKYVRCKYFFLICD